eukprot:jgi/Botrbrau1/21216/Bobra.39_2s0017.1
MTGVSHRFGEASLIAGLVRKRCLTCTPILSHSPQEKRGSIHSLGALPGRRHYHCKLRLPVFLKERRRMTVSAAAMEKYTASYMEHDWNPPLLKGFLTQTLNAYFERAPTAVQCLEMLEDQAGAHPIFYDHFAFRTFGVPGLGIDSLAPAFTAFGYEKQERLEFPQKRIRAHWFKPPRYDTGLPRIFISELKVEEFPEEVKEVVQRYAGRAVGMEGFAALCAATGLLPWGRPSQADFETLLRVSEYASWTLVNGYALNHTTVSVHRLPNLGIDELNKNLELQGFHMADDGGDTKVSPDGLLLQSSTIADTHRFTFLEGGSLPVPGPYLEFAERRPLPNFSNLPAAEIEETHRRDGFEVASADKIFSSTTLAGQGAPSTP